MSSEKWTSSQPYDLRERLFEFACLTVKIVQYLHSRGPIAVALSDQILRAGNSAGANYEEADDGSSARDVVAKRRIALRELKEVAFRLRVLRQCGLLTVEHDPLIDEAAQLIRILARVIRNS